MQTFPTRVLATVLVVVSLLMWSQPAAAHAGTVAGWVDAPAEVTPYLLVKAVESKSGMTARSNKLDRTHTFSFAGLPASVDTVEVVSQVPAHLFTLHEEASVLSVPIPATAAGAVELKVVVTPVQQSVSAEVGDETKSTLGTALLTVVVLVAMWFGRHKLLALLDLTGVKLPKQKKVMIPR